MIRVCPSIASCDIMNLEYTAKWLEKRYQHIHVDIEDGNYINNITFGMKALKGIRKTVSCEISVHLMVTNPLQYLEDISEIKPEIIFVHPDCTKYPSLIIDSFIKKGMRVGLAFNPSCGIKEFGYLMTKKVDSVLIMMCEPDGYGQVYIEQMEEKIRYSVQNGWITWVDGAITDSLLDKMEALNVHSVVMARAVFEKM